MNRRLRTISAAIALIASLARASGAEQTFTATQLRDDLAQLRVALRDMPPDLGRSANVPELDRALDAMDKELIESPPLTRDEAWREFATLNPLLADGHLFVGFVDWRADTRAHVESGGTLFPFEVRVTPDCDITAWRDPHVSRILFDEVPAYAHLLAINGVPAREACEAMMSRVHGETRAFRADLLSRRFWFFHWKMFGAPAKYELLLQDSIEPELNGTRTYPGRKAIPEFLELEQSFERQFASYVIGGERGKPTDIAVMKLGTFAWPDKERVLAFTKQQFESLQRWHFKTLIIDLTDNGGGNDDQWIEGVMPYVATRRWRTASTYRKRVVSPDPVKHEVAGAVVDGEMDTWYPPDVDNPLRFRGKIYLLVGPGTYSSAVVFANVMRDFGFATLAGYGGAVRIDQSGGTRRTTLANTGLIFVSPRFILHRPSGKTKPEYLMPAIELKDARASDEMAMQLHGLIGASPR